MAYSSEKRKAELYYWHREARSSSAEVDFLFIKDGLVIPIEVKSTSKGSMRSMHSYLKAHRNSKYGLKISELPYGHNC